jgi:opacity protein-like surface antigen
MIHNKLFITLAAASTFGFAVPTFAVEDTSGIYLGAQAGYTRSHYDLDAFLSEDFKKDELAGRAYVGFQLNQYLGLESGFAMLAGTDLPEGFGDVRTTHWDLLLKMGAPLGESGLRGDVKVGGTHVMWRFDSTDIATSVGLEDVSDWKIRPVTGASISYNVTKNLAVDASYLHVFGDPESSSFGTPTVDLAMLGVSFIFGPF